MKNDPSNEKSSLLSIPLSDFLFSCFDGYRPSNKTLTVLALVIASGIGGFVFGHIRENKRLQQTDVVVSSLIQNVRDHLKPQAPIKMTTTEMANYLAQEKILPEALRRAGTNYLDHPWSTGLGAKAPASGSLRLFSSSYLIGWRPEECDSKETGKDLCLTVQYIGLPVDACAWLAKKYYENSADMGLLALRINMVHVTSKSSPLSTYKQTCGLFPLDGEATLSFVYRLGGEK